MSKGPRKVIAVKLEARHFDGAIYEDSVGTRGGCAVYRYLHELYPESFVHVLSGSVWIDGTRYAIPDNMVNEIIDHHAGPDYTLSEKTGKPLSFKLKLEV